MSNKKDLLIAMLEDMDRDLKSIDWQDVFIAVACVALVGLWIAGVVVGWW